MKKHRKTVLAAIMLILVVASAVFAARVHTVSLDAENVAKITAKSTVTQAPPDEIVLTDSQCRELAEKLGSITLYKSFFKYSGWKGLELYVHRRILRRAGGAYNAQGRARSSGAKRRQNGVLLYPARIQRG